jgi:hypothetical protein
MPRKQRFKPSRKQPSNQQQPEVEKQQEVHPSDADVESDVPARDRPDESEIERSH